MKDKVKEFNKTKDRNLLENEGRAREVRIFKKKIKVGHTETDRHAVYLECEIKTVDLSTQAIYDGEGTLLYIGKSKTTVELEKITKYTTLSICGHSKYFAGQCKDEIRCFVKDDKNRNLGKILKLWDNWHLNDLNAGTSRQEECLKACESTDYDKRCEFLESKNLLVDRGYRFGTQWLVSDLPSEVKDEIMSLFTNFREAV